jgi:hypothetical protein
MDAASSVGDEVRAAAWLILSTLMLAAPEAAAEERYAMIVTGAPGGAAYATAYQSLERQLGTALRDHLGFASDHIITLSGVATDPVRTSTRLQIVRTLDQLKASVHADDLVLVVLIGHGTADGGVGKFNLPGPDMTSADWSAALRDLPGRLVFIDTSGGSFPFLADLSARGRIVITATQSEAERYDTVFPQQLLSALQDPAADLDKNGRVSIWELYQFVSRGVARHFDEQGLLATEHPLIDDDGDHLGTEATAQNASDGALARATYLERDAAEVTGDATMLALVAKRRALEERAEQLRQKKGSMAAEAWEREYEQLMIELARVSHRIRAGS